MSGPHLDWSKTDLGQIYPRLILFARGKIMKLLWRGSHHAHIPGGMTAKDFVQQAIEKTEAGERIWNREVTLYQHLCGVISSDINHLVESLENTNTELAGDNIVYIRDLSQSPEEEAIRRSQERHFMKYLLSVDPILKRLAELILYDRSSRSVDLSIELSLTLQQTENLKRRLRLAVGEYQESLRREEGARK